MATLRDRALAFAEQHPILSVVLVAFAVRLVVAVGVSLWFHGTLVPDDQTYPAIARDLATGHTERWDQRTSDIYRATRAYTLPMVWLFRAFGSRTFVGQLWSVMLGTATAGLVTALAMEVLDRRRAVLAGLVVALLPSQVIWSSITLKDAAVWAALAGLGYAVALSGRSEGRRLVATAVAAAALLYTLGYARKHTLVVAAWALVVAVALAPGPRRLLRSTGALLIALVVPALLGIGPGGSSLVADNLDTLATRRADNAVGAETALVPVTTVPPGRSAVSTTDDNFAASLSYLPRGLIAIVFEPFPWGDTHSTPLLLARLETVFWYPLLIFAVVGLGRVWSARRVLLYPVLVAAGITCLYALTEGNLGTAYRHRSEATWAVALLAAVGVEVIRQRRRPAGAVAAVVTEA